MEPTRMSIVNYSVVVGKKWDSNMLSNNINCFQIDKIYIMAKAILFEQIQSGTGPVLKCILQNIESGASSKFLLQTKSIEEFAFLFYYI